MEPVVPGATYEQVMAQIENLVASLLPGQHVYHLDLLVATRSLDDPSHGDFRRLPAPGSDPLMSGALMLFLLDELRVRMNPRLDLRDR